MARHPTVEWESSDFTRHGFIATYVYGECRCEKCTARWEEWDPSKPNKIHGVRRGLMKL